MVPLTDEEIKKLDGSYEKSDTYYRFVNEMTDLENIAQAMKNKKGYGYETLFELTKYKKGYLLVSSVRDLRLKFHGK